MENRLAEIILGGSNHDNEQHNLMELVKQLDELKNETSKQKQLINDLQWSKKEQDEEIKIPKEETKKEPRKQPAARTSEKYDLTNLQNF